jgi:hypothetical protein
MNTPSARIEQLLGLTIRDDWWNARTPYDFYPNSIAASLINDLNLPDSFELELRAALSVVLVEHLPDPAGENLIDDLDNAYPGNLDDVVAHLWSAIRILRHGNDPDNGLDSSQLLPACRTALNRLVWWVQQQTPASRSSRRAPALYLIDAPDNYCPTLMLPLRTLIAVDDDWLVHQMTADELHEIGRAGRPASYGVAHPDDTLAVVRTAAHLFNDHRGSCSFDTALDTARALNGSC